MPKIPERVSREAGNAAMEFLREKAAQGHTFGSFSEFVQAVFDSKTLDHPSFRGRLPSMSSDAVKKLLLEARKRHGFEFPHGKIRFAQLESKVRAAMAAGTSFEKASEQLGVPASTRNFLRVKFAQEEELHSMIPVKHARAIEQIAKAVQAYTPIMPFESLHSGISQHPDFKRNAYLSKLPRRSLVEILAVMRDLGRI